MRKSFKVAPGVRLNVSKKSVGLSAGTRGARVSMNTSGRVTRSVGVPGTGVGYVKSSQIGSKAKGKKVAPAQRSARAVAEQRMPAPKPVKPGIMAPAWEKALFRQLTGPADPVAIHAVGQAHPAAAPTVAMVETLRVIVPSGDVARGREVLGWLHSVQYDPTSDPFIAKYLGAPVAVIPVAPGVTVELPWSRDALGLYLAELEQETGNIAGAINIVEGLEPTTIAAVSLAKLYAEAEWWGDVVDLTNGLTNEDEASMFLLIQRATALREQGYNDAAREALKEALRPRSRPAELRHLALVARGRTYLADGKRGMARRDFERVLGEDAGFPEIRELLAEAQ